MVCKWKSSPVSPDRDSCRDEFHRASPPWVYLVTLPSKPFHSTWRQHWSCFCSSCLTNNSRISFCTCAAHFLLELRLVENGKTASPPQTKPRVSSGKGNNLRHKQIPRPERYFADNFIYYYFFLWRKLKCCLIYNINFRSAETSDKFND